MNDHLFVYGTLLRGARHPMHHVLARDSVMVGEGFFNGRLYRIGPYPGAVPSTEPGDRVFGELYRLGKAGEVLSALDEYEGCGPDAPPPTEFIRTATFVMLGDRARAEAWIYLYNRSVQGLERIRSGCFLQPGRHEVNARTRDGASR